MINKQGARSVIAALVAFCLSFSMLGTAFASTSSDDGTVSYVTLGDSVTNGYGLTGYDSITSGFGWAPEDAYPSQVAYEMDLDLSQLAMTSMRACDLEFMLKLDYADPSVVGAVESSSWNTAQSAFSNVGDYATWSEFTKANTGQCNGVDGVAKVAKEIQASVESADVVNLAVGNADFISFLPNCLFAYMGFGGSTDDLSWIKAEDAEARLSGNAEAMTVVKKVSDALKESLAEHVDSGKVAAADNIARYCVANLLAGYEGSLDRIVALNPDARIIVLGIVNGLAGMNVKYTTDEGVEKTIDVGTIAAPAIDELNEYFESLAKAKMEEAASDTESAYAQASIRFVDANEYAANNNKKMTVLVDEMAAALENKTNNFIRSCTIDAVCDVIFSMLDYKLIDGLPSLKNINLSDVQEYERLVTGSGFASWAKQDESRALSVAVYLGVENALIDSATVDAVDADSLMDLLGEGGLSAFKAKMLDGVEDQIKNAISGGLNYGLIISIAGGFSMDRLMVGAAIVAGPQIVYGTLMGTEEEPNETMQGVLYLFDRLLIGNGMGSHPDTDGHDVIAEAVLCAFKSLSKSEGIRISNVPQSVAYEGEPIIINPVVEDTGEGMTLAQNVDYSLAVKKGSADVAQITAPGTYIVTIEGTGLYYDRVQKTVVVTGDGEDSGESGDGTDGDGTEDGSDGDNPSGGDDSSSGGNQGGGAIGGGGGLLLPTTDISTLNYSGVSSNMTYSGSPIDINPVITDSAAGTTLVKGTDYTVAIKDSLNAKVTQITAPGAYTVTITGTGSYTGAVTIVVNVIEAPAVELEGMFPDVDADAAKKGGDYSALWYAEYLEYVVANGIMGGYTGGSDKGKFGVRDKITRGQVAVILYRSECANNPVLETSYGSTTDSAKYAKSSVFTDAKSGKYYTAALNWAKAVGIMTGDGSTNYTTVRPDDPVSRQELCVMLARFANGGFVPETALDANMSKNILGMNEVSGWAEDGVNWSVNNGVISGADNHDGTTSMNPTDNTERAAAAKMLTVTLRDVLG